MRNVHDSSLTLSAYLSQMYPPLKALLICASICGILSLFSYDTVLLAEQHVANIKFLCESSDHPNWM